MKANLEYLADSLIIEELAKNDHLIVNAQDGIIGSVAEGVKSYVASQFDKTRPIASIAAFLGRGLLWSMGFKWMSVLYSVAEAFGFDWKAFWSSVGNGITSFAKTILGSKTKSSEDDASSKINSVVEDAFSNSFTGEPDQQKIMDIAGKASYASQLRDAILIKEAAIKLQNNPSLTKNAGMLSLFKGKLARFFIKTISWLVKTALISLGFVVAGGVGSGIGSSLFGKKSPNGESSAEEEGNKPASYHSSLKVSPNVSRDIFTVHPNNMSSVWIEHGEISNVEDMLKSWVLQVYPQLSKNIDQIESSSAFQSMVNRFQSRNRLATGLGIISVPKPYQRKADIVAAITSNFEQQEESSAPNYM